MRILLVEDTPDLAEALCERLHHDGHAVDWLADGAEALTVINQEPYSLIVLDLGLPQVDGMAILQTVRRQKNQTPILILTARSDIDDRVNALDWGADDYLIKPVDLREFSARCRALLRRNHGESTSAVSYGNLRFDRAAAKVFIDDAEIIFPRRELCVLDLLLRHQGQTLSKTRIADQLCSLDDSDELPSDNAIELYIARLRKKLADSSINIQTLRGIGYILNVES